MWLINIHEMCICLDDLLVQINIVAPLPSFKNAENAAQDHLYFPGKAHVFQETDYRSRSGKLCRLQPPGGEVTVLPPVSQISVCSLPAGMGDTVNVSTTTCFLQCISFIYSNLLTHLKPHFCANWGNSFPSHWNDIIWKNDIIFTISLQALTWAWEILK